VRAFSNGNSPLTFCNKNDEFFSKIFGEGRHFFTINWMQLRIARAVANRLIVICNWKSSVQSQMIIASAVANRTCSRKSQTQSQIADAIAYHRCKRKFK
jgi:hypothetical protein